MISTVYIAKNVYGGDGLGRLGDGRVVFVPGAWAGEQVRAEIVEEKKHFVKARLIEVVESSPERLTVPSRPSAVSLRSADSSATGAGRAVPGMVYANLSHKGECKAKEQQLREFFDRARLSVPEIEQSEQSNNRTILNYRNKVVYHFAKQRGKWVVGYRTEPSHEIVDVENDPLARSEINAKLPEIRRSVLALLTNGPQAVRRDVERKGNVTVRWTQKTGVKWWVGDAPKGLVLKDTTCGCDFEVPADGFYQVNPEVGEALVKTVVEEYRKGAKDAPEILDLYCGVGVFGLCCNPPKLTGIESGRQAIDSAKRNAASQKYANAKFWAGRVGQNLRRISVNSRTTVIVDPPRDGMEPNVPKWLAESKAPRIFYVSCDPATLVRDLKTICRGYAIESVHWFNMFPRTARFETLVVLKK